MTTTPIITSSNALATSFASNSTAAKKDEALKTPKQDSTQNNSNFYKYLGAIAAIAIAGTAIGVISYRKGKINGSKVADAAADSGKLTKEQQAINDEITSQVTHRPFKNGKPQRTYQSARTSASAFDEMESMDPKYFKYAERIEKYKNRLSQGDEVDIGIVPKMWCKHQIKHLEKLQKKLIDKFNNRK